MPRATVDITRTNKVDLKSLPGGYVELRKLSYGQFLERQSLAMKMSMAVQKSNSQKNSEAAMSLEQAQLAVAVFEMRHCVASHNLEDDQGNLLDFRIDAATTLLDPVVGQEIGAAIDEMNQLPSGDNQGNSLRGSSDVSTTPDTSPALTTTTL